MRNKTAEEIRKILKMLVSKDEETIALGVGLFIDCWLLTQLNKHEKFTIEYKWPGVFRRNVPDFYLYYTNRSGVINNYTKNQFIKMLMSEDVPLNAKGCAILNFVEQRMKISSKQTNKRYYNAKLNNIFWNNIVTALNESFTHTYPTNQVSKADMYMNQDQPTAYVDLEAFESEIKELKLQGNQNSFQTPINCITDYKRYLSYRYNSHKRLKWIKANSHKLYGMSRREIDAFIRYHLCTVPFYNKIQDCPF